MEKAYARRMEEFLKFMPGIIYLETGEKFSTHDIANKFMEEITKLRPLGIGPNSVLGKKTSLNEFLELIAKDPQFKGHLDDPKF